MISGPHRLIRLAVSSPNDAICNLSDFVVRKTISLLYSTTMNNNPFQEKNACLDDKVCALAGVLEGFISFSLFVSSAQFPVVTVSGNVA